MRQSPRGTTVRSSLLALPVLLTAVALTACSSDTSVDDGTPQGESSVKAEENSEIAELVPQAIRDRGSITIATTETSPPANFAGDDGKLAGYTLELGTAIAEVLGLEAEFQAVTFDDLIPGVTNGRYDAGMGNIWMTDERMDIVNFASYGQITNAIMVRNDADSKPAGIEDLCGATIALIKGAAQAEEVKEQGKACEADGDPLTIQNYPDTTTMLLAVQNGRADATVYDAPILTYTARKMPNLEVTAEYGAISVGVALPKDAQGEELGKAISAAVDELMESGDYEAILERWSIPTYAIDDSEFVG